MYPSKIRFTKFNSRNIPQRLRPLGASSPGPFKREVSYTSNLKIVEMSKTPFDQCAASTFSRNRLSSNRQTSIFAVRWIGNSRDTPITCRSQGAFLNAFVSQSRFFTLICLQWPWRKMLLWNYIYICQICLDTRQFEQSLTYPMFKLNIKLIEEEHRNRFH